MMLMRLFFFFPDFLHKSICCGYTFELHRQVDAIQMGSHNKCLYQQVDKRYTGCILKTTELLDCAHRGMCGNKVEYGKSYRDNGRVLLKGCAMKHRTDMT